MSIYHYQETKRFVDPKQGQHNMFAIDTDRPLLDRIIISPDWMPYNIFKTIVVFVAIFSSFLYAYFAAFRYDVDYFCFSEWDWLVLNQNSDASDYLWERCMTVGIWTNVPKQIDAVIFGK